MILRNCFWHLAIGESLFLSSLNQQELRTAELLTSISSGSQLSEAGTHQTRESLAVKLQGGDLSALIKNRNPP